MVDRIFFCLKQKKKDVPFFPSIPEKYSFIFTYGRFRILYVYKAFTFTIIYYYYMLYETKKKKWQDKLCISIEEIMMWKTRQEFSTMTL